MSRGGPGGEGHVIDDNRRADGGGDDLQGEEDAGQRRIEARRHSRGGAGSGRTSGRKREATEAAYARLRQ